MIKNYIKRMVNKIKFMTSSTAAGLSAAIVILILLSGFFSATETAFSSLNRIKLKSLVNQGSKRAERTLLLSDNYDKLLTTILIGNNVVNIASASMATLLFTGLLKGNSELAVGLSTIVMTVMVLIFGEISPKSIAKEVPEKFAMAVSGIMRVMVIVFTPFNWLFKQWKKLLLCIFKPKKEQGMSEEDLITIVDEATNLGGLDAQEGMLIRSAIEFNDLIVKDIYTPRVDIFALPLNASKEEFKEIFADTGFSRLPVFDGDIDAIVGVLHEKDFYKAYFSENFKVVEYMSNVVCVTLAASVSQVLKQLQKSKMHMAVVIDEYGGTAGIITLEDIIEELVGEIWDEHDEVAEEIIVLNDNELIVLGSTSIDDLFEHLGKRFVESEFDVSTVSGWVIDLFGKVPDIGEQITKDDLSFKILDTDFRRIEKVQIKRVDANNAGYNNDIVNDRNDVDENIIELESAEFNAKNSEDAFTDSNN